MKSLKLFLLSVLDSLEFGWQLIRYALIFVSAFFRLRASLACEMVAIRSQLTFYEESIRQKRQPRPRFHPAFRLLWVGVAVTTDLQEKLLDNEHRTHARRQGQPPETGNADRPRANLSCYRWQNHCGVLYQTPIAA